MDLLWRMLVKSAGFGIDGTREKACRRSRVLCIRSRWAIMGRILVRRQELLRLHHSRAAVASRGTPLYANRKLRVPNGLTTASVAAMYEP